MTLYELLVSSSRAGLNLQNTETGEMPAGHNGLYRDPETPVRNTGHWLMLFLKAHQISGEEIFLKASEKAVGYLMSRDARPVGATFYHRMNPEKDACNGLIGQAWSIEALVQAGLQLEREECLKLAREVFLLHPFESETGIWQRVAVDGMHLPIDETFNHQLWFAAAASPLGSQSEEIHSRVERFLEMLSENLKIYSSGLIYHHLPLRSSTRQRLREIRRMVAGSPAERQAVRRKAIGYHLFNLYGFAMLSVSFPDHQFWQSERFRKVLEYASSDGFRNDLVDNPYAYPYNPPGFEMALSMERFGFGSRTAQQGWLREQVARCYNRETSLMDRGSEDAATHSARLYEAVRLPDMEI